MAKWASRLSNSFGLTDRQAEAVKALVRLGSDKQVARALGISHLTASTLLRNAQRHMGARSRVDMAVKWDRYSREFPRGRSSVFDLGQQ